LYTLLIVLLFFLILISTEDHIFRHQLYAQEKIIPPQTIGVKITFPTTGQEVPAGKGLKISGTSTDNAITDCQVSIIVNDVKPYQPVNAIGPSGINDYSTWDYLLTSNYSAVIREGPDNKITSKLECPPNLTKWYSVNVTGVSPLLSSSNASFVTPSINAASTNALFNASILNITSPTKGQPISSGSKITAFGTSIDDFYKNCKVYAKKNDLPFQKVTPLGLTGANDYSIWKFIFTDEAAKITPGNTNNLTAMISCFSGNYNPVSTANVTTSVISNSNRNNMTSYAIVNIMGLNHPPTAIAKTDSGKEVKEGDEVVLDGTDSSDPNGDSLTYLWKQLGNLRNNIDIVNPNEQVVSFRVPNELAEDTTFTFNLTVRDSYGETSSDTVTVDAISNSKPTADAGGDIDAVRGEEVVLDGTDSRDPDPDPTGEIISYVWKKTKGDSSANGGGGGQLQDANQPVARFSVPYVQDDTTFEFTLTVTDDEGAEDEDTVEVEVKGNSKPLADAGSNKKAVIGEQVTLDGKSSVDSNGKITSYSWEQTGSSTSVDLDNAKTVTSSFVVPNIEDDTTFEFTLTVTDDEGAEDEDTIEVEVEAPPEPQLPDESGEICFDDKDNNDNGLTDEECEFD
jgi:hypothetical protein